MANLVEANDIVGLKVYGQQQVDYTVEGTAGCDFGYAVARAALLRSVATESALSALSGVVRLREKKVSDLGEALSYISAAVASFKGGDHGDEPSKTVTTEGLCTAATILDKYGIRTKDDNLGLTTSGSKGTISNGDSQKLQTNVQYEMDKEDNYLQQDMVTLQSYFSKRDQALSMAASLVKKVNNTMTTGIQAIH